MSEISEVDKKRAEEAWDRAHSLYWTEEIAYEGRKRAIDFLAAALARRYREGIEAMKDAAIKDRGPGTVYSKATARSWLEGIAARLKEGAK